jgi:hypothetical protein
MVICVQLKQEKQMQTIKQIHEEAVHSAKHFRKSESMLLESIIKVERHRVFEKMSFPSVFKYCVEALRLTEGHSYALIGVARKSREVPELKSLIDEGKLHVSNARRIVSVITPENKEVWLEKATTLSQRNLEREVVKENPKALPKERIRPVTESRSQLTLAISTELEAKLRRAMDLVAQKNRKAPTMEDTLEVILESYLEKHDLVRKAKRLCPDTVLPTPPAVAGVRTPIPAPVRHTVNQRDQGQCTFTDSNDRRCTERRWLVLHHHIHVAHGGANTAANLATVCQSHHRCLHTRL